MIIRRTTIDQLELLIDGTVNLRLVKQIVEDDSVLVSKYHRTVFSLDTDIDATLDSVNQHMAELGEAEVSLEDKARIKATVEFNRQQSGN